MLGGNRAKLELNNLIQKYNMLVESNNQLLTQISNLTSQNEQLTQERNQLALQNRQLQQESNNINQVENDRNVLAEQNQALQQELREMTEDRDTLADDKVSLIEERDNLQKQNMQLQQDVTQLANGNILIEQIKKLQQEVKELKSKNNKLQTKWIQNDNNLFNQSRATEGQLLKENQQLKDKLLQMEDDLDMADQTVMSQIEEKKHLEEQVRYLKAKIKQSSQDGKTQDIESDLANENVQLKIILEALREEIRQLKAKDIIGNNNQNKEKSSGVTKRLQNKISDLEEENTQLRIDLGTTRKNMEHIESKSKQFQYELRQSQEQINQLLAELVTAKVKANAAADSTSLALYFEQENRKLLEKLSKIEDKPKVRNSKARNQEETPSVKELTVKETRQEKQTDNDVYEYESSGDLITNYINSLIRKIDTKGE